MKIFIFSFLTILLLFLCYKLTEYLTSYDRLIDKFEQSINENNAKDLSRLLSSNDNNLEINERTVIGLLKYYNKHHDEKKSAVKLLKEQSEGIPIDKMPNDEEKVKKIIYELAGGGIVNIHKKGKFLFFDTYELFINPVYLKLGTNFKNTVLYVDGEEIGRADKSKFVSEFGPFVPGYHLLEAKLKTDKTELHSKEVILLTNISEIEQEYIFIRADEIPKSVNN